MATFIDSHVHLHRCFPLNQFFSAAHDNFETAVRVQDSAGDWLAVLLLTETAKDDYFLSLRDSDLLNNIDTGGWTVQQTQEDRSLIAVGPDGKRLILIAGRQIVTAENLEILWIGTAQQIPDGEPARQLISRISRSEGIAIIPWGPGKWFGRRGNIVQSIVSQYDGDKLYLGDNGNRPNFWPTPTLFRDARDKGIHILPGSDPLPMASEAGRAGTFGFIVDQMISTARPATDLLNLIQIPNFKTTCYGQLESFDRFFRNQLMMQLIKKGLIKS